MLIKSEAEYNIYKRLKNIKPKIKKVQNKSKFLKPKFFDFYTTYFLFIFLLFTRVEPKIPFSRKESSWSLMQSNSGEITIKIDGTGPQLVISEEYSLCPDIIYLNGNPISPDSNNCKQIDITDGATTNTIKVVYNGVISTFAQMFKGLTNLKEVDLSNFDSSYVVDMNKMFHGCISLISIDFSNLNTALVESMEEVFSSCSSLIELDLSALDTSKVKTMKSMFFGCSNLKIINFEGINTSGVETMNSMFYKVESIEHLDLSPFDTSNVVDMGNMFQECKSLIILNLINFNTSSVVNMQYMFYYCEKVTYLDLSSFKTPNLIYMNFMFVNCKSLISINIENLLTSKVTTMYALFGFCESLVELDLSFFDTSNVMMIDYMFYECHSLKKLNLSNFDVSKTSSLENMFANCYSLTSLDLSNFNTQNVEKMTSLFYNCYSLTSLDLSSFDTSNVKMLDNMFYNCTKLSELNLSNFDTSSLTNSQSMFENCINLEYINFQKYNEISGIFIDGILDDIRDNIVFCLDVENNIDNLKQIIDSKRCPAIDCSLDWKTAQKKLISGNLSCIENCQNYPYENQGICYEVCPEDENFCRPEIIDSTYSPTTDNNEERNEISTYIDSSGSSSYINNNLISTSPLINNEEQESINNVTSKTIIPSFDLNIQPQINIMGENNEEIYEKIIKDLLHNYNIGNDLLIEGKDNFIFHLTTLEHERDILEINNINVIDSNGFISNNTNSYKLSKIDLGLCENILKDSNNLNRDVSLILLKFEKVTNISSGRVVQFDIYEPFNKKRMNLSLCNEASISIYHPVTLSNDIQNIYNQLKERGYDLFDINSVFYQDICTTFTSSNGTDVILSDRINY